jgi:hypothetical protein
VSADLRVLADTRSREAAVLLNAGESSGAYYLAGYAVECALKAVITRAGSATAQYTLLDRSALDALRKVYTHDFVTLIEAANLTNALRTEIDANPRFQAYWGVAKDWKESSRYELWTLQQALEMVEAVTDGADGVLRWIRSSW